MNTVRKSFYCLFSALLGMSTAYAAEEAGATLMEVNGTVLVNQGKNYQAAQSGMKLAPNARVFTKDKASAVVTSKQGCITRLGANSLFVVKPTDPCHGGAVAQKADPSAYALAGGTGGAAGTGSANWFSDSTNQTVLMAAGGVAAAVGIGVGVGLSTSDSNSNDGYAVGSTYNAVIATGGSAQLAQLASAVAAQGGSPQDIYNAIIAAGGTSAQAGAASAAFAVAANGGGPAQINQAIQGAIAACSTPTSPNCNGG